MSNKRFLLHLDILGSEELAKEISSKMRMDPRKIRHEFVNVMNDRAASLISYPIMSGTYGLNFPKRFRPPGLSHRNHGKIQPLVDMPRYHDDYVREQITRH